VARELTSAERQALKGRAHRLDPVVLVGGGGLTPTLVAEVDRALRAHELVKIRVMGAERAAREAMLAAVCEATAAAPVQHIGKVLVVYRERPAPQASETPAAPRKRPARAARAARQRPPHRAKIRSR
jgi:putative YhbY family RNA-binding protein